MATSSKVLFAVYYLTKTGLQSDPISPEAVIAENKSEDASVKSKGSHRKNITEITFTVEQLCKLIFMSRSQLHRKLEALTGCSPNKFIRIIRLDKAKELLKNPGNSIASIALDCGYNDPGYFARVFKQEHGATPQEWRVSSRVTVASAPASNYSNKI